jgi:hypothetical protein
MEVRAREVEVMKGMKLPNTTPKPRGMTPMLAKHEQMIRRAANHNVHIITHHGKIMVGRKGRTT